MKGKEPVKGRLCSEIQLFDLCDKSVCNHKNGRFCTKSDVLARFEAVLAEDDSLPEPFLSEEVEGTEDADGLEFDDDYGLDDYGEEDSGDFADTEDEQH